MFVQACLVSLPTVVEARLDLHLEGHPPPHAQYASYQAVGLAACGHDRHEVQNFCHAVGAQETGDEDVGIREVELFGCPVRSSRGDPPVAAALPVEDRTKKAGGVETWAAVPIDRPLGADERDRV